VASGQIAGPPFRERLPVAFWRGATTDAGTFAASRLTDDIDTPAWRELDDTCLHEGWEPSAEVPRNQRRALVMRWGRPTNGSRVDVGLTALVQEAEG
jgi:hypothetical protein